MKVTSRSAGGLLGSLEDAVMGVTFIMETIISGAHSWCSEL